MYKAKILEIDSNNNLTYIHWDDHHHHHNIILCTEKTLNWILIGNVIEENKYENK